MKILRRSAPFAAALLLSAGAAAEHGAKSGGIDAPAVETAAAAATTTPAPPEKTTGERKPKPKARSWEHVRTPVAGPARAIGTYQAGCVAGAEMLTVSGPGYVVARPGRRRHFGHPDLVGFVRDLGAAVNAKKLGGLVVGDLGQPRGGPAPDGHSSHQSGLDADLWYPLPEPADRPPTRSELRALRPLPVANFPAQKLTEHWSPRVARVLELAAKDARVDRIFVNPMIKRALCESEQDRSWLRKLRPWWGHDAHFHVRLACPKDSPACEPQAPIAQGDGCEAVDWWFRPEARAERDKERAAYRSRIGPGDRLPAECQTVLAATE